jgi:hypothetical protein
MSLALFWLTGGWLISSNAGTQRRAAYHRRGRETICVLVLDRKVQGVPGGGIGPVPCNHQGVLSVVDGAGKSRRCRAIATETPGGPLVGNLQCVREIGAPPAVLWIGLIVS